MNSLIRHPEASHSEAVRISSFYILILEKIEKDEILTSSGIRHRTPQNDKLGVRDCHVAALLAMTEQEKNSNPPNPLF